MNMNRFPSDIKNSNNLNVALLFLGRGNFGKRDTRLIYHDVVDTSMALRKFGMGQAYLIKPLEASQTNIAFAIGGRAEDAGGPDFVIAAGGALVRVNLRAGVGRAGIPGERLG